MSSPIAWHERSWQEALALLRTVPSGLSEEEARRRLADSGPNALPPSPAPSVWAMVWRQLRSPLIAILVVAAGVSVAIGDAGDAGFIGAVLLINALVGGWQEWQAERQTRALQELLSPRAEVLRDGEITEIDAQELVPGDVVWVESGQRVPADLRLLHTHNLEVDESLLTGESLTVLKDAHWLGVAATPLADRRNMLFSGSTVVRGRGRGITVATGTDTSVGQLALDMLAADEGQPPLLRRMDRFSRVIATAVVLAAAAVALLGVVSGYGVLEMVFFAVALAVSAIPEGLPVVLTVALAVATRRMARRGVIVRRLPAVEGLGSCTLIASDKTGTLTCNALTVRRIVLPDGEEFSVSGEGFAPEGQVLQEGRLVPPDHEALHRLARASVLCSEADLHPREDDRQGEARWSWRGDPTEIALLSLARKLGWSREVAVDRYPRVNEIPFEPEHRFSASFHVIEGRVHVLVKGAPERVLPMCISDPSAPSSASALAHRLAAQGFRVLALAEGPAREGLEAAEVPPEPSGLSLLGFVGMIDPLRPGVPEAVAACHRAGIAVWMVTGDHPGTALAIGRELGLADEASSVVTGGDLEGRSPRAMRQLLGSSCVFARMAPHQKLQLVNAAREAGHCVAATGDGVNDAPALRAANIGVAMGRSGTDVAREAAELVIADDNFATIVAGVEEGRIAYANVRKVIYLLVSTGAAEIVLIALAMGTGLPLPLLPIQLLWLNLVTNGIQDVALAFEPGEGDVLRQRPRPPGEPILDRLMVERTLIAAAVMGGVAFATFAVLLRQGWPLPATRNAVLLLMVLFENVHIGNCRSETRSAFLLSPLRSPVLLIGTVGALGVHVLMMQLPLGRDLLEAAPVPPRLWACLFALSLTVLLAIEVHKLLRHLLRANRSPYRQLPVV